jgi:heat shock protein HslJ
VSATAAATGTFENVQWKLEKYSTDGTLKQVPTSASIYAEFKGGKLSGKAVNAYSGPYKAGDGSKLSIGSLSATLMEGPPELQAVESAYFAALPRVTSYTSDGSALTLSGADGDAILVFSKSKLSILGMWKVTAYNNGKHAVVSALPTPPITMSFAANGRVAGDAGINRYDATYMTSGTNAIEIGPAATTRKAGAAQTMEQERRFLAALSASKIYRLKGQILELVDPAGALQVSAQRAR